MRGAPRRKVPIITGGDITGSISFQAKYTFVGTSSKKRVPPGKMSSSFLPAPLEKMFKDFKEQQFPFTYNIVNDGHRMTVNVSWSVADQERTSLRVRHQKPPSVIRRDSERMSAFLRKKNGERTDQELHLSPQNRPTTKPGMFPCSALKPQSKSLDSKQNFATHPIQAEKSDHRVSMETQTESTQKIELSVQTDCNRNSCEVETQCASLLCDGVTQTVQCGVMHRAVQTDAPASQSRLGKTAPRGERADRNGHVDGPGDGQRGAYCDNVGSNTKKIAPQHTRERDSQSATEQSGFLYKNGDVVMDIFDNVVKLTGQIPFLDREGEKRRYTGVYPFGPEDPNKKLLFFECWLKPCERE